MIDLRTISLSPLSIITAPAATPFFPHQSFLIGNHADELTPWMPLFANACGASFVNIPCCAHQLMGRFTRQNYKLPPDLLASLPQGQTADDDARGTGRAQSLVLPFYASTSEALHTGRYFYYQLYIAHLTLLAGYIPEREALRIPSTRNFGILGRRRTFAIDDLEAVQKEQERIRIYVQSVAAEVEAKGWIARTPEGKAGEGH